VAEIYRLRASSRKRDILKEINPIEEIEKFIHDSNPNIIYLIYDLRRKNEDHASIYFSHVRKVLFKYFGVKLEKSFLIKGETKVEKIRIEYKDFSQIFPILVDDNREFNFADQLYILRLEGNKVLKSMIVGSKNYYKFLETNFSSPPVLVNKIPYRGRTTVENEEEKKLAKKVLLDYFNSGREVLDCLFEDACGKTSFERLVLPGKEEHMHWRRRVNEHFEEVEIKSSEDFKKLVEGEDAACFYPPLTKQVIFKGKPIKVKHKFVCEYDPPEILRKDKKGREIVAKISDTANSLFKELEIPSIYLFSGSKSARNQSFIDYEDVLENLEEIKREFPFLGYAFSISKGIEDECRNIVSKCFNSAFYLELVKKLHRNNLLKRIVNGEPVFNVTHNPRSEFRALSVLVDFPHAVSIGIGSPKTILRDMERKELTFLGCAPIEKYPVSEKEMLNFKLENISDFFRKNYQNILKNMESEIKAENLEKIFKRFEGREREFLDFQVMSEERFMEKYYGLY
jgi:hypothetical protein